MRFRRQKFFKCGQTVVKSPESQIDALPIAGKRNSKSTVLRENNGSDQHFTEVPLEGFEPPTVSLGRNVQRSFREAKMLIENAF